MGGFIDRQQTVLAQASEAALVVDTKGGRMHVRWEGIRNLYTLFRAHACAGASGSHSPSVPHSKPRAGMPHSTKASNSAWRVLRQAGTDGGSGLGEEGCGALLHLAVQRGLLGAQTLQVNPGSMARPVALLHRGLHALPMSRRWCSTVSNPVRRQKLGSDQPFTSTTVLT